MSHFGGHRLAPTLVDWPEGRWWGFLDPTVLPGLVRRDGPVAPLRRCYRGWGGLDYFGQLVERELLVRFGWGWTRHLVSGQLLEVDGAPAAGVTLPDHPQFEEQPPRQVRLRLAFAAPDGSAAGAYDATAEAAGAVPLLGACGQEGPVRPGRHRITQYRVTGLRLVAGQAPHAAPDRQGAVGTRPG